MNILSKLAITITCLSSSLSAQEELPEILENDITCECITTFTLKRNEIFYLKVGEKYYQAPLRSENSSAKMPLRGTKQFKLYKKEKTEEDEVVYEPILETALTGTGKEHLVIIRRQKKEGYSATSHSLSLSNFPADRIHVLNETPVPLGFKFDEFKMPIKARQHITYKYKPGRLNYASASIHAQYNGKLKSMGFRRLRLIPGKRFIFICVPSEERKKMGSTPIRMISY